MTYKVRPYCTKTGNFAPALFVEAESENEIEKRARELSGLARFENWNFTFYITKVHSK